MDPVRPVLAYAWAFAPTVAISVKVTPSADRSTLKPSSSIELSVQARLIRLLETAAAVRLLGAAGGARPQATSVRPTASHASVVERRCCDPGP